MVSSRCFNHLKHLLLSPRPYHDDRGYECFESCNRSLLATKNESNDYNLPRYALANGFAIGDIPKTISFTGMTVSIMSVKSMLRVT